MARSYQCKIIVNEIANLLITQDPQNTSTYNLNRSHLFAKLDALDQELRTLLSPIKNYPFLVFHDGYQYLEHRYGLNGVGSITLNPSLPISAKRLWKLGTLIETMQVRAIFAEAQYTPALAQELSTRTGSKLCTLDPLGSYFKTHSEDDYFTMMRNLANQIAQCLVSR